MASKLLIGLAVALALYVLFTKTRLTRIRRAEPKKARKQEKAEIMRQLLALSDREQSIPPIPPATRSLKTRPSPIAQPPKLHTKRRETSKA